MSPKGSDVPNDIRNALAKLTPREARLLRMRFGISSSNDAEEVTADPNGDGDETLLRELARHLVAIRKKKTS